MKAQKLKLKDKKVSPSVYFFVPIIICLLFIGVYTYDTFSNFDIVNNYIELPVNNEYEVVRTVAYKNNEIDMSKYFFSSGTPIVDEVIFEEDIIPVSNVTYVPAVPREVMGDASVEAILAEYNLTYEQFYTLVAIVAAEGGGSYIDAYAVINVIYNRAHCRRWIASGNNYGDGTNLFIQATLPSQFTVYASGSYLNHMYETGSNAYNATVTLLTSNELMHNYMSFRSASTGIQGVQFISGGNIYFADVC